MKKIIASLAILSFIFLCTACSKQQEQDSIFGIAFTNPTNSATTTQISLPVMVLNINADRKYASIQNDSDTVIYLHLAYFASASDASSTVLLNEGFRLLPSAANEFIIDEINLYTGQVWATSSAASKNIIYLEK